MFLRRDNSKCPAIILAVSRTERVIGRIIFLIVSIITINDDSIIGVPSGTRCVNMWLVWLIHPKSIIIIHNGKAIVKEILKWLVEVKI